mmetsp:Transcript_1201/g.2198  ORF Transcript_1201/g.2198 Transcript_1201/m.2198 type:complete len:187 (-) Transcript_1201:296-856(-)
MFGTQFSPVMGILAGGFYLHNISLPIYRGSKYPEKSVRDMFIGFLVVCLSYCVCGTLGTFGFNSEAIFGGGIHAQQNCLNQFDSKNVVANIIRICTFFQLLASCSLIFACQRSQILLLTTGNSKATSDAINIMLNFLILIGPAVLGVVYPQVGKLAGILGLIGGILVIYILPTVTFTKQKCSRNSN